MKIIELMLVNIKMMKNMGKVFILGPTENAMMVVGKAVNSMVKLNSQILKANHEKAYGKTALVLNGLMMVKMKIKSQKRNT